MNFERTAITITFLIIIAIVLYAKSTKPNKDVPQVQGRTTPAPANLEEVPARAIYRITAYCPCEICCGQYSDGITASGTRVTDYDKFCAAPARFPFRTKLKIKGYGVCPVLDRGGAIKGNRIDVYFPTHEMALEWGVKWIEVEIAK